MQIIIIIHNSSSSSSSKTIICNNQLQLDDKEISNDTEESAAE